MDASCHEDAGGEDLPPPPHHEESGVKPFSIDPAVDPIRALEAMCCERAFEQETLDGMLGIIAARSERYERWVNHARKFIPENTRALVVRALHDNKWPDIVNVGFDSVQRTMPVAPLSVARSMTMEMLHSDYEFINMDGMT